MIIDVLRNLDTILQIVVVLYVIMQTALLVSENEDILLPVFFLLAMTSFLASDVYWIAHIIMMPDTRVPFTASEIGNNGFFLLMGATLSTAFQERRVKAGKEIIGSVLFVAASTALWVGWSGEWVKDILSGAAYGYFVCRVMSALKASDSLSRKEWTGLAVGSAVLIVCQAAIFHVPEQLKKPLDVFCYVLMFVGILCFFVRNIRGVRSGENADILISLSFALYAWVTTVMYMSADPIYFAADTAATIALFFMLYAVKKKMEIL